METLLPAIAAYVILTVVLLWVGNAGAKGSLTPNGAVGVRTTETRKSLQAWTRAHRAFLPFAVAVAVTCAVFTVVLPIMYFANFGTEYLGVLVVASYVVILGIVIAGGIAAHRVAKEYNGVGAL